jgi:hypothetical protein
LFGHVRSGQVRSDLLLKKKNECQRIGFPTCPTRSPLVPASSGRPPRMVVVPLVHGGTDASAHADAGQRPPTLHLRGRATRGRRGPVAQAAVEPRGWARAPTRPLATTTTTPPASQDGQSNRVLTARVQPLAALPPSPSLSLSGSSITFVRFPRSVSSSTRTKVCVKRAGDSKARDREKKGSENRPVRL